MFIMQGPIDFMNPEKKHEEFPLLTAMACAACVVLFIIINAGDMSRVGLRVEHLGAVPAERIWAGEWWGLFTSVFVHIEIWHVAFNVYWLWILGGAVEKQLGSMWFTGFFIAAAWVSSGIQFLTGHLGIGMSGVAYALFGFVWMARYRYLPFRTVVSERTAGMFIVWFVLCFFLDATGAMRIGNGAHAGGLVFGVLVSWCLTRKPQRTLIGAGMVVLVALSIVPLFGIPWSGEWTANQAMKAMKSKDYESAVKWLRNSLAKGEDPEWGWHNLAEIYGFQERAPEYADALAHLRQIDAKSADEVEARYGKAPGIPIK